MTLDKVEQIFLHNLILIHQPRSRTVLFNFLGKLRPHKAFMYNLCLARMNATEAILHITCKHLKAASEVAEVLVVLLCLRDKNMLNYFTVNGKYVY